MSEKSEKYTESFRREAVRLSRTSGRSVTQLSRELGIGKSTLHTWRRQLEAPTRMDASEPLTLEQAKYQLMQQQKRITRLEEERDILKKATAFFANETKR